MIINKQTSELHQTSLMDATVQLWLGWDEYLGAASGHDLTQPQHVLLSDSLDFFSIVCFNHVQRGLIGLMCPCPIWSRRSSAEHLKEVLCFYLLTKQLNSMEAARLCNYLVEVSMNISDKGLVDLLSYVTSCVFAALMHDSHNGNLWHLEEWMIHLFE